MPKPPTRGKRAPTAHFRAETPSARPGLHPAPRGWLPPLFVRAAKHNRQQKLHRKPHPVTRGTGADRRGRGSGPRLPLGLLALTSPPAPRNWGARRRAGLAGAGPEAVGSGHRSDPRRVPPGAAARGSARPGAPTHSPHLRARRAVSSPPFRGLRGADQSASAARRGPAP